MYTSADLMHCKTLKNAILKCNELRKYYLKYRKIQNQSFEVRLWFSHVIRTFH